MIVTPKKKAVNGAADAGRTIPAAISTASTKKSQESRILNHLLYRGPVTAKLLSDEYGIMSPRKRLSELARSPKLQELGCELRSLRMTGHNRFGEPCRYNMYYLEWPDDFRDGGESHGF